MHLKSSDLMPLRAKGSGVDSGTNRSMWMAAFRNRLPTPFRWSVYPAVVAFLALAIAIFTPTAQAVVVLPKGATQPVMGYLVRQDAATIVVREVLPGGKSRETAFRKSEIDELLITVSPDRLAALDPAQPRLYREYAEELAEKHRDPEARDAALRLFHMAAVLGDAKLRRGSLLGLAALARSPQEERRFRAAAYLYDPEHDPKLLADPDDLNIPKTPVVTEPLRELLAAIRLARQGKGSQARATIEPPQVREQLAALSRIFTPAEFLATCAEKELSDAQLYKLLRAETAIVESLGMGSEASAREARSRQLSWSAAVHSNRLNAVPSLSLVSLTEFDPRACLFKDGKWVRP